MTKCADCDRGHLMSCGLCPEYHKEFPADLSAQLLKAEVERLRAHTWQQERAAIIRFIDTKLNNMTTIDKIHVGDLLKLLIKVIDAGEHWPEGAKCRHCLRASQAHEQEFCDACSSLEGGTL